SPSNNKPSKTFNWKPNTYSTSLLIFNKPFCNPFDWIKTISIIKRKLQTKSVKAWSTKTTCDSDPILIEQNKILISKEKRKFSALLSFRLNILAHNLPTRLKLHNRYLLLTLIFAYDL